MLTTFVSITLIVTVSDSRWSASSLALDVRILDELRPFRVVLTDQRSEFRRLVAARLDALRRELCPDVGCRDHLHDLGVPLVDDGRGRAGRRQHAVPRACLV